eukprot:gnl/Dysnectes_brevis/1320_a1482_2331.p1 GENE.gnl/Dysnectes_brevis/1320_a1482_2331~~gnl/Dysnectes_brevis/1320_a1482_2331.p1  ORF type:complete len:203 (-),score=51.91 gnl/Dysnectes_brevis/1320_a1482_2331:44-652(-)
MGNWRNFLKRIEHKERVAPKARRKLGHLERKKDYVKRAQHYHKKEKYLQDLRLKAEMRNPDEYYHAMENHRTRGGIDLRSSKQAKKDFNVPEAIVDAARRRESKRAEAIKSSLPPQFSGEHIIFDEEAAQQAGEREAPAPIPAPMLDQLASAEKRLARLERESARRRAMRLRRLEGSRGGKKKVGEDDDGHAIYRFQKQRLQ